MDEGTRIQTQAAAEAIEWFLRLRESPKDDRERAAAFSDWLLRSPIHIEEFLAVSRTWASVDVPENAQWSPDKLVDEAKADLRADNVLQLRGPPAIEAFIAPARRRRSARFAVAASALCLTVGVILFSWFRTHEGYYFETDVGELRSISLEDGSVVSLDTKTAVRIRLSAAERHVDLLRGEARFQVAKNRNRPFIVGTQNASVRAVGTVFDVRAEDGDTQVTVIEGRIAVSASERAPDRPSSATNSPPRAASAAHVELVSGQNATVTRTGIQTGVGPALEQVTAWPERLLVFRDEPLSNVVREFNRYHRTTMQLEDPSLGSLKISGVFESSDPESLLAYLSQFETVSVTRTPDGNIHLSRSTPP